MRRAFALRRIAGALRSSNRATVVMEFGLLAPVMFLLLMGAFDIGHSLYMTTVMQGAVQKAARDSGLETGVDNQASIDAKVTSQVKKLAKNATVTIRRKYYKSFSKASNVKESFTDTNGNNTCDAGEPYVDENNSGSWDSDAGVSGQGSAKDAVVLSVTATYPRMFPLWRMIGLSDTQSITATTVMDNQPYSNQTAAGSTVRNCS
jgi:Flp pilus assembly protein TadG